MAQVTNTYSTYDNVGGREELSNIISMVAPEDTPFLSMIEKDKVKTTHPEWIVDALAAPGDNAIIEGDEFTYQAVTPGERVGNFTQISRKSIVISGTQEVVDQAGNIGKMARQIMKKGKELRKDMDRALLANNASVAGDDTTPRELAGLPAWLETNVDRGAGGADGGFNAGTGIVDAATDGTQRDFTIDMLRSIQQAAYDNGSNPNVLMMGSHNRGMFSGFEGIAPLRTAVSERGKVRLHDSVDIYDGDFGEMTVMTDRQQRARDVFVLDTDFVALGTLRPIDKVTPAKTGDNEKQVLLVEYTLIVRNEAALAQIADLTTS